MKPMGSVIDDTWVVSVQWAKSISAAHLSLTLNHGLYQVQRKHGPFDRSAAPKTSPPCTPDTCQQYDHWAGRLGVSYSNQTQNLLLPKPRSNRRCVFSWGQGGARRASPGPIPPEQDRRADRGFPATLRRGGSTNIIITQGL